MKEQTAVEWLVEYCERENWSMPNHIIDIAKEMEKEQMKNAYHDDRPSLSYFESGKAFEEYYNENYEAQETN